MFGRCVYDGVRLLLADGFAVSDDIGGPGEATAFIEFQSDGDVVSITGFGGTADIGDWLAPKAIAPGAYEIMAQQNSGDAVSGSALDTWLPLSSARSWGLTQTGAGSKGATLTVSIGIGGIALASGTVSIGASVLI